MVGNSFPVGITSVFSRLQKTSKLFNSEIFTFLQKRANRGFSASMTVCSSPALTNYKKRVLDIFLCTIKKVLELPKISASVWTWYKTIFVLILINHILSFYNIGEKFISTSCLRVNFICDKLNTKEKKCEKKTWKFTDFFTNMYSLVR